MALRRYKTKSNQRPSQDIVRRETPEYPSVEPDQCHTFKSDSQRYSGSLVKGIATMHKSNAVPVIDDEQAKDISKMRRN